MHSVDLLEEAIGAAMDSGLNVRQEWLGDQPGGVCRIGNNTVLFVNLSLSAQEQLQTVASALSEFILDDEKNHEVWKAMSGPLQSIVREARSLQEESNLPG